MKKRLFIVDDDRPQREKLFKRFDELNFFDKIETVKSYSEFSQAFNVNGYCNVGLFDINLNIYASNNKDGLKCASLMRELKPDSFIITHSNFTMLREDIENSGSNEFFDKDAWSVDETFEKVKELIGLHYDKLENGLSRFKMKGEIRAIIESVSYEKGIVNLECEYGEYFFEKVFPISKFSHLNKEDLVIDTSISILILENDTGGTSISIKKSKNDYLSIFEQTNDEESINVSSRNLINSPIFSEKNSKANRSEEGE